MLGFGLGLGLKAIIFGLGLGFGLATQGLAVPGLGLVPCGLVNITDVQYKIFKILLVFYRKLTKNAEKRRCL